MNQLYNLLPSPPARCMHYDPEDHYNYFFYTRLNHAYMCLDCKSKYVKWSQEYERISNLHEQAKDAVTLNLLKQDLQKQMDPQYWFLSVRPPPETTWEQFKKDVAVLIDKVKTDGHYCFEQKGDTEETMGHGFHIHLICEHYGTRDAFLKMVKRNFPYITNGIVLKVLKGLSNYNKVYGYITGAKEEAKKGACLYDDPWRKSLGLLSLYSIK